MLILEECDYVPLLRGGGHTCFWCGSHWHRRWSQRWHRCLRRRDTFLSAQTFVNQWLEFYQMFMDMILGHSKDAKNWLDFGDFDLLFKVTAVKQMKILWHFLVCEVSFFWIWWRGWGRSVFSENTVLIRILNVHTSGSLFPDFIFYIIFTFLF